MNLTAYQKRKLRISLRLIFLGVFAGVFFVILSDGIQKIYPLVNGAIIGFLIAIVASYFEFYIYERKIRKQRFAVVLVTRSLFYLLLIVIVILMEIGIARMLKENLDFAGLINNKLFRAYIFEGEFITSVTYAFAIVVVVNFSRLVSRKLGYGVLSSLITGKYYHPKEQERVFMFLNISSSSDIVKKLGRHKFHEFINDFVFDITLPILNNHGIIYQYVEDEIVISWDLKSGTMNANSIRCYFEMKDKIHSEKEKYITKYGVYPVFFSAINCGKVVKGEIGSIKTEIAYHGDTMNTTSRILGLCKQLGEELLVSSTFMKIVEVPIIYRYEKKGNVSVKGKQNPVELFSIHEVSLESVKFA